MQTDRLSSGPWAKRRRWAPAILAVGAVVVGSRLVHDLPRTTDIRFGFGPDHQLVKGATISYLLEGEAAARVEFHWADGAPEVVQHEVKLASGQYEIRADLAEGVVDHVVVLRKLQVPAEGVVHIDLFDSAYAQRNAPVAPLALAEVSP